MKKSTKFLIGGGVVLGGLTTIYLTRGLFMYGLISKDYLDDCIISVVNTLGGGQNARLLLAETAAAESKYGEAIDIHIDSGKGLMQFDKVGFDDTKARTSRSTKDKIWKAYGVDMNNISFSQLDWSPLLSVIFARCFYLLRPGAIPSTLQERAEYWKKYYNTSAGKGTVEHYIKMANAYPRPRLL